MTAQESTTMSAFCQPGNEEDNTTLEMSKSQEANKEELSENERCHQPQPKAADSLTVLTVKEQLPFAESTPLDVAIQLHRKNHHRGSTSTISCQSDSTTTDSTADRTDSLSVEESGISASQVHITLNDNMLTVEMTDN